MFESKDRLNNDERSCKDELEKKSLNGRKKKKKERNKNRESRGNFIIKKLKRGKNIWSLVEEKNFG